MINHHARKDLKSLNNLPDILDCLASLEVEEKAITESLHAFLSDELQVNESLRRLRSLSPQVNHLNTHAELLSIKLGNTARTADNVAGRVRMLDEEMKRVKEAGAYVAQVMELKTSLLDLRSAIDEEDWETAARLCARALSLPTDMISSRFAGTVVPTADLPSPPTQLLEECRTQLRDIFLEQFANATRARDPSLTTRFFKLFPPIGCEKEGLEAYANFVLDLVQTKAPLTAKTSSPLYYVTALTALFESVCNIIDQHQLIVEKYYGIGKMQTVILRLLKECDNSVKKLLDGWEEDRDLKRKLMETGASQLSNNSLASLSKPLVLFSTDHSKDLDPRDVDKALNEMAAMVMRFTAFRRFICSNTEEGDTSAEEKSAGYVPIASCSQNSNVIDSSGCRRLFDSLILRYYVPLDTWYLRSTITQAFKSMTIDLVQLPPVTNVPDLVFYILKSLLTRLINTGSVLAIECVTTTVRFVLEEEYVGILRSRLNDVFRTGSSVGANRIEKTEKEMRFNFIVLLNDLDISSSHMDRLVKDIVSSQILIQNFLDIELEFVHARMSTLLNITSLFRSTLKGGIDQLFNQLIRPRLRVIIPDVYKDITYDLDEDSYSLAEQQDLVRKRFVKSWDDLLDGFKDALTGSNYRFLLNQAVDIVLRPWEKYILTLKYSELGAIRFDQDIRSISTYFSTQLSFGEIREKLQRLQQISTLLNIDKDEDVDDFYRSSGISWKLTSTEAHSVASLKL